MNYTTTPTELCILQECLYSANVADVEYSGVRYMFLPLGVSYFSKTPQVKLVKFLNVMTMQGPSCTTI